MKNGSTYQATRDRRRPDVTAVTVAFIVLVEPTKSMMRWHNLVVNFFEMMEKGC